MCMSIYLTHTLIYYYRCLNPNSGDTGGLLDYDFLTPQTDKLNLLARVQPHPSFISAKNGQYCIAPGAYANPKCAARRLTAVTEEGAEKEAVVEEVVASSGEEERSVSEGVSM